MLELHLSLVWERKDEQQTLSDIIVVDTFFSKNEFVNRFISLGFRFECRLQSNALLQYLAIPNPSAPRRKGKKTKYAGKVEQSKLEMSVFNPFI